MSEKQRTIKLNPTGEVLVAEESNLDFFINTTIGFGVCAARTSLKEIKKRKLNKIVKKIKQEVTFNYEVEISEGNDEHIWITLQDRVLLPISDEGYRKYRLNNISLVMGIFKKITKCEFIDYESEPLIDCPINSIEIEKNLVIHRKNAIKANIEQLGIIQGEFSKYIVRGYGSPKTHCSCSYHGQDQRDLVDFRVELVPLVKIEV